MSEHETTTEMLAEIDRDLVEIETAVAELAREALQANYPQQVETTTDTLAEIEGQATEYTPPEGWRVLRFGEPLRGGDEYHSGIDRYIRRIGPEPQPEPQPDKVITPNGVAPDLVGQQLVRDLVLQVAAMIEQQETTEQPQPEKVITPDDVANAALAGVWNQVQAERTIEDLQHRLDVVAAEWAEQARAFNGLQQQLEAVKAELVQERLERNQWQNQAQRTETQLIEKISKCRNLQIELDALQQAPQAETAAAVPTSTEDRFEQGWDAGTARAVETIAEWTEPFRQMIEKADNLVESDRASRLCAEIMQNLPHIMRSLTGLTPED